MISWGVANVKVDLFFYWFVMVCYGLCRAYRQVNWYTGPCPSFGGNALNSSHLLSTANAQRTATASDANNSGSSASTTSSNNNAAADLFVRQLQGRLLSALASQVTEAIFGQNPQDSGTITFGDT